MSYVQTHVEWLDRQPAHPNGYPTILSEENITWLESTVKHFLTLCAEKSYTPALWEVVQYWTCQPDRPNDLELHLADAINGVTHRALLAVARPCWTIDNGRTQAARRPYTLIYNHLTANPYLAEASPEHSIEFRLFDDDGILYFTGRMSPGLYDSQHVLLPLDDAQSWGCTRLDCKNPKNGNWETI